MKIPVMCCTAIDENPRDILTELEMSNYGLDGYQVEIKIARKSQGGWNETMFFDIDGMEWF